MIRWPATELDPTSFPAWREAIDGAHGRGRPLAAWADTPPHPFA